MATTVTFGPVPIGVIKGMIEDCEDQRDRLTAWERAFIDSISAVGEKRITGRQLDKLTEIWSRVTTTD